MGARRFTVKLADGRTANVMGVGLSYTFECVLEARCFSAGTGHYLSLYEERRDLIEAGKLKGFYCFEPELIDEYQCELEFGPDKSAESARWIKHYMGKCFKDNKMSVLLTFDDPDGRNGITLEWYQTTKELSEVPLASLIQEMAGRLKYEDIRNYCKFTDWSELG